jgi:hypothetical protein
MKQSIGIVLNNLASSQAAFYAIVRANQLLKSRSDIDFALFIEQPAQICVQPNFAVFPVVDSYNWSGDLIATDLNNAQIVANTVGAGRKFFYIWDLEWLRFNPRQSYEALATVYRDNRLQLITRSKHHQRFIANNFNRDSVLMEDFNYGALCQNDTNQPQPAKNTIGSTTRNLSLVTK